MTPRCPGTVETLARAAAFFDSILSPMAAMALGLGPIKTIPASASALANAARSDREAVARMHRLGTARLAGSNDVVDDQIALRRRRRPDRYGVVGHFDVERVAVGLGIDRHGFDSHPAGGLDDPAGDLAAIGNQDALEHLRLRSREPACPLCGGGMEMSMTPHIRDQCRSKSDASSATARSAAMPCQICTG